MLPSELKHRYPRVRTYDEEDQGPRRYHIRAYDEEDSVHHGHEQDVPKWEGPYRVVQVLRLGAVRLETEGGVYVGYSWNIEHLCKFYP